MTLPIGTVVSSLLDLKLFQKYSGRSEKWVLADGSSIPDSEFRSIVKSDPNFYNELHRDGNVWLPDLQGVFLRGMQIKRNDGKGNPEPGPMASFQWDDVGPHQHSYTSSFHNAGSAGGTGPHAGDAAPTLTGNPEAVTHTRLETRPRNMTVAFYIRID